MSQSAKKIIIVEDNVLVRNSLKAVLEIGGYDAFAFDSAEHFCELVKSTEDAAGIIIDYRLPGQSGIELAFAIKKQNTGVPIIMMSGNFDKMAMDAASKLDNVATLRKPCNPIELLDLLEQLADSQGSNQVDEPND